LDVNARRRIPEAEQAVTRILILDEGFMSGAHTAYGLAAAGHDVAVLAATGGRGRCIASGVEWRLAPTINPSTDLERAISTGGVGADVIYPVTEPLRALSWKLPARLASRLFPDVPSRSRQVLFGDKRAMSDHVASLGVPTPAQSDARDHAELGYPCVIKGRRGRGGSATDIVVTPEEAECAIVRQGDDRCFAQEYVEGQTYIVGGLFDRGRPLRIHVACKVAQYPRLVGPASRLETVDEPSLLASALAVFAALEHTGLGSVDFIRRRDGTFAFLEVNPRPWGSIGAARDAGVDLFAPLGELLMGGRVQANLRYAVGVASSVFPLYLASRDEWRHPASLARSVWHDLGSESGRLWHHPLQAAHLGRRLFRVTRNWPRPASLNP
jgi:hypothetical protein